MKTERKKLKVLAVGDLHGDRGLVKKLAKKADEENIDLVILAGDLTWAEQSTEGLVGPFMKSNRKVLMLHGNHEDTQTIDFLTKMYPGSKNMHGYGMKHKSLGIFGIGGADSGSDPLEEKEAERLLEKAHIYVKDSNKKILISHMHPAETFSEFSGLEGSSAIRKAIEKFQPDFAIFGHIHEAAGAKEKIGKTTIINTARKEFIFEI